MTNYIYFLLVYTNQAISENEKDVKLITLLWSPIARNGKPLVVLGRSL